MSGRSLFLAGIATAVILGVAIGLGLFTFVYAGGTAYLGNDPAACAPRCPLVPLRRCHPGGKREAFFARSQIGMGRMHTRSASGASVCSQRIDGLR